MHYSRWIILKHSKGKNELVKCFLLGKGELLMRVMLHCENLKQTSLKILKASQYFLTLSCLIPALWRQNSDEMFDFQDGVFIPEGNCSRLTLPLWQP